MTQLSICILAGLFSFSIVHAQGVAAFPQRISVATDGTQANGWSYQPLIGGDGRFVIFNSGANNFVSGIISTASAYVHDNLTGSTEPVISLNGTVRYASANSISNNGRYVAFNSSDSSLVSGDTNGQMDTFVQDVTTGITIRVSMAAGNIESNGYSTPWAVSNDGNFTLFDSSATNLVPNDTNGASDIFLRDISNGVTTRVSVATDGTQGGGASTGLANFSVDARFVVFTSDANNLVSGDAGGRDVFLHDRISGATTLVSTASDGTQGNGQCGYCEGYPEISGNGRFIVFISSATNLVSGDTNGVTDVFVKDLLTGITTRESVASDGSQMLDSVTQVGAMYPQISDNGRFVTFSTFAANLVGDDTNNTVDAFIHDRDTGMTYRISVNGYNLEGNSHSHHPDVSGDGRVITFYSDATNMVPGDTNGVGDIFVKLNPALVDARPNAPMGFVASMVSTSSLSLAWTDNSANEDGYQLERSFDGVAYTQIATTSVDAAGHIDNGLSPATSYYYRLRAFNVGGASEYATTSAVTEVDNHAPVLSLIGNQAVNEGGVLSLTLSASDRDGDSITYSASNLPTGAVFDAQTHVFSWTPAFTQSGVYPNVVFTATDSGNPTLSITESITITIDDVNRAPLLLLIGSRAVNEGGMLTFTLSATDPDEDSLTYGASNLPLGATFDAQTHTFSWVPSYSQAGNYTNIEFTVTDSGGPIELAVELVTVTVGDVNRAPVFAPLSAQQVLENAPLSFTVFATDPDGDTVSLMATSAPSGATFNALTGLFSWTPGLMQAGVCVVIFVATDNGLPVEQAMIDVVITVGDDPTPVEQAAAIVGVVVGYNFPTNIENSYLANLKKVENFIQNGQVTSALNQLNAFIVKVNADYGRSIITQVVRDNLLAMAQLLIAVLNN